MRQVRYYEHGGPEVLRVEEADVPRPGPGEALIRTEAIGANFIDTKFRRGDENLPFQRPLPAGLTGDVVGVVEAVGDGVAADLVGSRVASLADPAFAEYVTVDAAWLVPVPDGVDLGMASMLSMGAPVALGALRVGRLAPGETVLVHAAAGGIGHQAVQLAKLLGAGTVIATASSAAKLDFAKEHGADVGIDYTAPDWPDQVRAAAPDGVHVLLDSVGGTTMVRGLDLLAPLGTTVLYGMAGGDSRDLPATSLYALRSITGFSIMGWRQARPEQARQDMADIAEHAAEGRLRTAVHATFSLDEVAKAHQVLDDRAQLGRLLVVP